MRFIDLIGLIFYNLGRRKGRVALTAVGVVIGTAAVVLLLALASGLQRNATNQFSNIADLTFITVQPQYDKMSAVAVKVGGGGGSSSGPSQVKMLTNQTISDIAALPGVDKVIARDMLRAQAMIKFGRLENGPMVMALDTNDYSIMGYEAKEGVLQLQKGEVLLGETVLQNFNDPKWRPGQPRADAPALLGQQIKMVLTRYSADGIPVTKTIPLRVVGILKEKRSETDYAMVVRMDDITTWNEWANGKRINRNKDGYDTLMVKAADSKKITALTAQITDLGYMAYTPQSFIEGINNFYTIIQIVFGGIGAIALLVAAIGIANTMTMAILERTREIGLMKAVGATNRNVMSIFLGEAAGIGLIGGLGGVALAWAAAQAVNVLASSYLSSQAAQSGSSVTNTATYIAPWLPLFALGFSTLVGLLSGLYPALRAATMIPVLALKYE
jgi:putative ABC transport system permease protein